MDTRRVHALEIALPGEEPDDLERLDRLPVEGERLIDYLIAGDVWARASVSGVTMNRCWLQAADLSSTIFTATTLDRCVLTGCTLVGARFDTVTVKDVLFDNCRLDYATLHQLKSAGPVAFVGCSLTEATFTRSALTRAAFDGCKISGLTFDGCDLRGADLRGNDLSGLSSGTALRGATVSGTQVPVLTDLLLHELSITVASSQ